jgi:hypothetical protein
MFYTKIVPPFILASLIVYASVGPLRCDVLLDQIPGTRFSLFIDEDKKNCGIQAEYPTGLVLILTYVRLGHMWSVGIIDQKWNLPVGNEYDTVIAIDSFRLAGLKAKAVAPRQVAIYLSDKDDVFLEKLTTGRLLGIRILSIPAKSGGGIFLLDGIDQAVAEVERCTDSLE